MWKILPPTAQTTTGKRPNHRRLLDQQSSVEDKAIARTLRQAQGERKTSMKSGRQPLMLSPSTALRTCLSKHGVGLFSSLLMAR